MFLGSGGGAPTRVSIYRAAFHPLRVRAGNYRTPRHFAQATAGTGLASSTANLATRQRPEVTDITPLPSSFHLSADHTPALPVGRRTTGPVASQLHRRQHRLPHIYSCRF
jgi:hypothetical protein